MNNFIKLGIFTAFGLAAVLVSVVIVGNWSFSGGYDVYAVFDNAAGLNKKAKVRVAGVDIGVLEGISLKGRKAQLKLKINNDVKIYQNASAKIVSMGIIGTKYIELDLGDDSYPQVKSGDTIASIEVKSLESLIDKLNDSVDSERNGNMFENLADSVNDLKKVMDTIAKQDAAISRVISNFDELSSNLVIITEKLDLIVSKINTGSGTVSALINDEKMGEDLKDAVASAKETLANLRDSLGTASHLRFEWDYLGRYNTNDSVFRNDVGIKISPNNNKFYYVGVANLGNTADAKDDEERNSMNKLEALLGFRFNRFEVFGGIIRGQGGLGVGYSFFEPIYAPYKKVQAHIRIYDMGRKIKDEPSGNSKPRVDADLKVGITKWLYTGVMIEDAIYKSGVTPYIKIEMNDEDISRMLGIIGLAATASK